MHALLNIVGYVAGVCTTFGSVPQIVRAFRTKSTKDLSYTSLWVIDAGAVMWTVYGILLKNGPLILWDAITVALYTSLIAMKYKYDAMGGRSSSHTPQGDAELATLVKIEDGPASATAEP